MQVANQSCLSLAASALLAVTVSHDENSVVLSFQSVQLHCFHSVFQDVKTLLLDFKCTPQFTVNNSAIFKNSASSSQSKPIPFADSGSCPTL